MAAGNETLTTLANVLKTKYDEKKVVQMAYENDWFLQNVRKDKNFGGNNSRITLRYGDPQGGSALLATAILNQTSSENAGFLLIRAKDYHVCSIDAEAMLAGKGDENTVLDALDAAMEGGTRMIGRSLEIGCYGDGTGARGTIDSTVTGTTLTLAEPNDIVNFEVGMKIQFANPTGPALRDSGEELTISAIDRDDGSMTVSANLNTIIGLTAGDLIVRSGDLSAVIKGVRAWLPWTRPTGGDNFFGQDRSTDATRLAGVIYDGAGGQKVETIVKAVTRLSREGGVHGKRVGLLHIEDMSDIAIGLGAKVEYEPVKNTEGTFGFESLTIKTPRGNLRLYGSINVPKGTFFILQMDTWVLKSIKSAPHIVDDDGITMLRGATTDSVTWRMRYYAQLGCTAPGYNLHGRF